MNASDQSQPTSATDAQLMQRLACSEMSALALLVERHQDILRRLAFRLTNRWDAADDIAQETFLRIFRSASSYRPTAAFRTWAYRIVVNLCLDRAKSPRHATLPDEAIADRAACSPDVLIRNEQTRAVQDAVAALPERQRIALVLHRFENLTHAQIAITTGWSKSAVESLLVRAYDQLRQSLKEWSAG